MSWALRSTSALRASGELQTRDRSNAWRSHLILERLEGLTGASRRLGKRVVAATQLSYGEVDGPPNSGLPESGFSRAQVGYSHRLLQPAGDGCGRVVLDQTNWNMR